MINGLIRARKLRAIQKIRRARNQDDIDNACIAAEDGHVKGDDFKSVLQEAKHKARQLQK